MKKSRRSACPVACVLDLIGDKWTLLVVRDMACGTRFFNDFCRSPERIATNILADRLERLIAHGLAEKVPSAGQPGRDAYRLTAKGKFARPGRGGRRRLGIGESRRDESGPDSAIRFNRADDRDDREAMMNW